MTARKNPHPIIIALNVHDCTPVHVERMDSLCRFESRLYGATLNGSCDAYLASPVDFAGVDDIITELGKGERAW